MPFVFLMLAISVLFFIISGIQYWASDYLQEVLGIEKDLVHIYFSITCITAPVIGALLSGVVMNRLGGYRSSKALPLCLVTGILAMVVSLPIPFSNNYKVSIGLMWLLLFFGAFILPTLTGVMLSKVRPEDRPVANSLANLSYNLFGYFPAPVLYGLVCSATGGRRSRWGMALLMFMTIVSFLFILLAYATSRKAGSPV